MGDEKDPSANLGPSSEPSAPPPAPVSVVPRPVSVVPRPSGGVAPSSRIPPAPSSRGFGPAATGAFRSAPPPPPQRQPSASDSSSTLVARPSVVPRPPATPPPPRSFPPPAPSRSFSQTPSSSATAQLEQRLGATQIELRKLGSERHTLRARLRRESDRSSELESALRAEKELRRQASEEHFGALNGVRARLAELDAERQRDLAEQLEVEAERELELATLRAELVEARAALQAAAQVQAATSPDSAERAARFAKAPVGLRRIRGIGPAYQRVLEQLGVTRVQQVAAWSEADVRDFAQKLKIRPERITKDDWVGQACSLEPDA